MTRLIPGVVMVLVASAQALACATCFGRSDSPLAEGMNMGILVLLGVILTVLAGFVVFFVFLARRAAGVRLNAPGDPLSPPQPCKS